MNKKIFTALLMGTFAALMAISAPIITKAQDGRLRNQTRFSKAQIGEIIDRVESSSNEFRRDFVREIGNSPLHGTRTERDYDRDAKNYEKSLNDLRRQFDRNNSWWLVRNEVSDVINKAQPVNNIMNSISFRRNLERQWNAMRRDINTLADTYDLPGLNGGGWNGGPWNGRDGGRDGDGDMNAPPSWARGTFYGTAPDGSQITLTLDGNGRVTAMINGNSNYGRYDRGLIYLNGASSRVTQWGNGVRTTRTDNREVINYSRNGWNNGNNGNDGNWNGNRGVPISWAVGSFYAANPAGGQIYLTIARDGQVTVEMGGGPVYGTLYGTTLTIAGATATVERNGNGIRTVRNDNGERINYRRR
jgi:hypothetical protein